MRSTSAKKSCGSEADAALPETASGQDFCLQFVLLAAKEQTLSHSDLSPGRTRHSHSLGSRESWRVKRTSIRPRRKSREAGFPALRGCAFIPLLLP